MLRSGIFQVLRRLAQVRPLFIAASLCLTGYAHAQAPNLTAGGVPNDTDQWNLGPTGMAGWCYREGINTSKARQFLVRSVATGSPAAGIMAVNDVILGASGTGVDPVNFTMDARIAFAQAITDAEEQNPATLKILRWRAGVTSIVSLTLETLGAYSATAPYSCPKSAAILEKGLQYMMNTNANDGNWRYSALTLLAANDPNNPNNSARQTKAATELRQLILSPATIALYTSGKSMGKNDKPWHIGPKLIALAEYYLKTGDPDPNVMASIRAYAHCAANGQSLFGTCGHFFTDPGFRNTPVNGPYNIGYGPVNNAAIPCYIGLTLAKKCGLNDPEILAGIERAGTFYAQYTHLGCAGYGEHLAYEGHDTNGKAGMQALAFQLEGDRLESTKYYARASTAAAIAERDIGHTGSFFAFLYAPLGANVGGPDAMAYYFRETKWMYELARRWDGSFVYNSFSSGGVEVDSLSGPASCLMATPMLLTYAMPLRQTYLTGRDQNTANWITPAEIPEVSAASAHIYNAPSRTTTELVSDLSSWSPKVRRYAGRELKLRTADHAAVLPTLHDMAANESASFQARAGACLAMGEIGISSSVPVLLPLVTHPNFVVRYSASLAIRYMPATANKPHVDALMQACITNARPLLPLDPEDPMQTVNGNLCNALFAAHAALYTHDLVGLNRELLFGAMRVCAANAQAEVRNGLHNIYPKLTQTDIDQVGDVFVNVAYENAPAGMGVTGARKPAMSFLQSKGKAEGVPLAIRFAEDLGYNSGGIDDPINVLVDYAGSSNTVTPNPDVEHFCEVLIASGAKYGIPEAQAVLAAIAADTSPDVLTPFKSIDWIIPDHATFNLPKKSTVLRVHSKNRSNPTSTYTWRKLRGAGTVSFTPNGTSAAKDATVVFDGTPGQYLFEVTMSDSHGLTEVSKTVEVTLRNSGGTLPPNSPPTANGQSLTVAQGAPTQVILTGADPEGYALNYTVTSGPSHGSLSGTAPHLVYTAAANYTGSDSFTFQVEDSEGQTATAMVNITVNTAAAVGLAIYEPFNKYPVGALHNASDSDSIGLLGTWTTGSQITTEAPSLSFGTLPTIGNKVKIVGMNSPGGSRPINPSALAGRGLMDNGATLWFSVVMGGYGGYDAGGNVLDLALANNSFPTGSNIPNDGSQPGSGLGVRMYNKGVYAAQYYDASVGAPLTGAYDNTVAGGIVNDNPRLVVCKITWGAASDAIEIYLPGQDMILPSQPTSVLAANVDQSTFDTLTFSRGSSVHLDEIRFGATLQSVLQGTVEMSADVTAPTPNPMTFSVAPAPASSSSITMTATPAHDGMGVEYFFTCTGGGGNSSGWQSSNVYTDTGLTPGVAYSYTVKARDKHPALNETTPSAAASATIPALGTVPGVEGLPESLAQSLITNAALTVGTITQSADYSMTVPVGHVLSQSPADGTSVAYGSAVNIVISIGQDPVLPVLSPLNIVDNKNGEQVEVETPITFTLTFSKDIDDATLDAGDFINAGDAPVTIGAITETSPGVVSVSVTPSGTVAGILRFAVAAGAVIEDTLGNDLNTSTAIIDNTVISIVPIQPKTQTFTGNNGGSSTDNWSTALNWNLNTGPVPSGTDNVIIPANKVVMVNLASTAIYNGNLTLGVGAHLQAGNGVNNVSVYNCLGIPGTTTISMADGSRISFRDNNSPAMPAIVLQGNAEITTGSSSSPGSHPIFNYPITGPYALTLSGKSPNTTNLNVANNFGHLILATQYGTLFTVNANLAGSLSGDVTVMADYNTGGKGANLVFAAANAMSDTATLSLFGNTGTLVTLNASDTIGGLKLNGVKQLPGTYNSGNSTWIAGTGTLTVNGGTLAYWNPSGGPSGIWDDSNIWNTQANLAGIDNAWAPGKIATFNTAGTYGVTLNDTKEIGGLVVSNGTVTLLDGGLSLSSDTPVNVASGATLAIDTVIEQNSLGLSLHKSGTGTLNLLGENTFTGPVAIGAGTLSIATIDNAGAPSALGQYLDAGPGGLILAGGTLRYTGGTTAVNRGFIFTGNSTIDVNNAASSLTLADVETAGPGTLTVTGGVGSSLGLGNIKIVQSNNIALNPTTVTMSVASVEGYSNYPLNATITLGGSSSGNVVTGGISASVYPESAYQQGTAVVKTGTGDWRLAGAFTAGAVANNNLTVNDGTLILAGNNTYTGHTLINNASKLVLDFAATNTSKIGGALYLAGGTLEMKGGSHIEVLGSSTLNAGPTAFITRNGGTAKLRMNAITRNTGGTIIFLDGTVADTDRTNTNGILGGYATIGGDWAVNSTNGADGAITPLSTYDTMPNSGGSATANYLLSGSNTLAGAVAANSLKITNTANNQTLNLGTNIFTITSTSASALGGVLYAGGDIGSYTISGSGGLLASSTTGELVVNTHQGTLIVNAPMVTSGATAGLLTKSGPGSLVLGGTNVYTGATRVVSGKLFVNGSLSSLNASLTIDPGATLGGSGTLGRNVTIANRGALEFNLGAPAASHVPLTRSSSRTFAFSGTSVLTITSSAGATPGLYTLITGGNNITGSAPATVILPPGWTADPPVISTNQLRINITSVVYPPNSAPVWRNNPLTLLPATEDAEYSGMLTDNASDPNNDALTFTKISGSAWLSVASNGALSGTPSNADVGPHTFTVSVSDGIAAAVETTLQITVINVNGAPYWDTNPVVGANAAEALAYSGDLATVAEDEDLDAVLTFAKVSGPAWLNVAATGIVSGTPSLGDAGLNIFTVSVSDGIATPVEATLQITVANFNNIPTWTNNPIQGADATEDLAYAGNIAGSAQDLDPGASLTFAIASGPAWLSVAANGTLSGVPANDNVGLNSFTVSVSDGIAAPVTATLNITVINTNDAPAFTASTFSTGNAKEETAYTGQSLAGSAIDMDPGDALTYSKISGPEWLSVAANGALSGTPPPGSAELNSFVVRATDIATASADATLEILVTIPQLTWDANGNGSGQTNGAGVWLTANQWWNGSANLTWVSNSNATFGGLDTAGGAVTLASPTTVKAFTFNNFTGTYTLGTAGQAITLNGGINKNSGSGIVEFNSGITLGADQTWTNNSANKVEVADNVISPNTNFVTNGGYQLTIDGTGTTQIGKTNDGNHISISGSGALVKNGTGFLQLGGNNSAVFSGKVTINGGVVNYGQSALSLGSGNIEINNGVIEAYWATTVTRAQGTGANEIQITGGVSGLSGGGGGGPVYNIGAITWGSATFNPTQFVLNSAATGASNAATLSSAIDLGGTTRTIRSDQTGGIAGGGLGIFSGNITNGAIIKEGIGTHVFAPASGSNTYSGGTTINGGALRFDRILAMPGSGAITVNTGAILGVDLGGSGDWTGSTSVANGTLGGLLAGLGGAGTSTVVYSGHVGLQLNLTTDTTYSANIANVGTTLALYKTGSTALTLSGTNSYTGGTTVSAGTLNLGHPTNTLADAGSVTVTGGTLALGANSDTVGAVTITGGTISSSTGVLTVSSLDAQNGTISAKLVGASGLTKTGTGTVTISGVNTYSGGTNINAGTLALAAADSTTGLWTVQGGTLQMNNTAHSINSAGLSMTSGSLKFNAAGTTLSGGLITLSGGTIDVPNSGAGTIINNDQRWNGNFNTSLVNASGQTITSNGDITLGANVQIGNKLHMIVNGDIGETGGSRSLTLTNNGGTSTFTFAGNNTYSGGTTVNSGILNINSPTAIGTGALNLPGNTIDNTSGSEITLSTNNVFNITGNTTFTGTHSLSNGTGNFTINGNRTITVNANKLTIGGNQTAVVAFGIVKAGAGTLALLGSGVQTGAGSITGGTLEVGVMTNGGVASSLGATSNTANQMLMSNGTTLRYVGSADVVTDRSFTINGTADGHGGTIESSGIGTLSYSGATPLAYGTVNQARTLTLGGTNTGNNAFGKIIANNGSGVISLVKSGAGTWILNESNIYTGATTASAGKLIINGSLSNIAAALNVASGATLGGTGTIGRDVTIAAGGKLAFDISTPAAGHDRLDISSGRSFAFSGPSELTITSSGGMAPGTYILITGGNNITGVAPAIVNMPAGWSATASISGNSLLLDVTGTVDQFAISSITSPQTAGTAITGITITAQDVFNITVTSFTGTVTFGGTAGITGTSANFINGVLSGVSATPSATGANLTLTVDDGAGHTGSATFTVQSPYSAWAGGHLPVDVSNPAGNNDGDPLTNLQEYAFGTDPTVTTSAPIAYTPGGNITTPGTPLPINLAVGGGVDYRAVYGRRKNHQSLGLTYNVQFSADFTTWVTSTATPTVLTGENSAGSIEAVSVPYPFFILTASGYKKPTFFRVAVSSN